MEIILSVFLLYSKDNYAICLSSLQQTPTEHVHLSNDDELNTQMGELGDIVQYLKHQANRGDVESQVFIFSFIFSFIHFWSLFVFRYISS